MTSAAAARSPLWRGDGEAALRAWYARTRRTLGVAHESLGVETSFGQTHVIAVGAADAPPVVLLHGTNANALTWKPQFAALAAHYRVYAPDILGAAGLSAPTRLPERGPAAGEWLAQVLDGVAVWRAHLAGVSGGAWNVLKLAGAAPERVRSAVLMSPGGIVPVRFPFRLARIPAVLAAVDTLNRLTVHSAKDTRRIFARTSAPGVVLDDETLDLFTTVLRSFRTQPPPDALPEAEVRRLTGPSLVLLGEHEIFLERRRLIAVAERTLPGLRAAEIVPGAGHALPSDRPDVVNARLLRFFSEVG